LKQTHQVAVRSGRKIPGADLDRFQALLDSPIQGFIQP
jgi:hypothetical protein